MSVWGRREPPPPHPGVIAQPLTLASSKCKFAHDGASTPQAAPPEAAGHGDGGAGVCWDFQKGDCRRGDACRFAHDGASSRGDESLQTEAQTSAAPGKRPISVNRVTIHGVMVADYAA